MDMIDFADPELRNDPHPVFEHLRRENPICPVRGMRAYLVTRYEDCAALLKSNRVGFEDLTSLEHIPAELRGYFEMRRSLMLFQNPPEHQMTRKSGEWHLGQCESARREAIIRESARCSLERLESDFISEVARPFVADVIVKILGLREIDLGYVTELAQDLADSLDPLSEKNSRAVAGEKYLLLKEHVARHAPTSSGCPHHGGGGEIATMVMLVAAGLQTTSHILGLSVRSLLEQDALRSSQEVSTKMVDELFRFHCPAQLTRRVVTSEIEVQGKRLLPGTVLWLALASANRDEEIFADPHEMDFERSPNRHLAFGLGGHHCIGYKIARMQLKVFLEEWVEKFSGVRSVSGEASYNGNLLFKGLASLPLKVPVISSVDAAKKLP